MSRNVRDILKSLNDSAPVTNEEEKEVKDTAETPSDDTSEDPANDSEEVIVVRPVKQKSVDDAATALKAGAKRVRKGKVVKITAEQARNSRKARGGQTVAQHRAALRNLKRAAIKAKGPAAQRKKERSMKIRKMRIGDSVALEGLLDVNVLLETLQERLADQFAKNYEMDEEQTTGLYQTIVDNMEVECSADGKQITVKYPQFDSSDEETDFDEYEVVEAIFDTSDEGITNEDVLNHIFSDFDIFGRMV